MKSVCLDNYSAKVQTAIEKNKHFKAIVWISQIIENEGRLCWLAGGAVRDFILGLDPHDIDVVTDATHEEILKLFPRAILVGVSFGVYKIPFENEVYDLAVFRKEGEYVDGRRPTEIFRSTPEEDALRRDFKMNALFFDLKNQKIIDYVGGVQDIENHKISCVGDPKSRFLEDHLRILRLVRFKYQLGFEISEADFQMALSLSDRITSVSGERLSAELLKLGKLSMRVGLYRDLLFQQLMRSIGFELNSDRVVDFKDQEKTSFYLEFLVLIGVTFENQNKMKSIFKFNNNIERFLKKACEIEELLSGAESEASDYILKFDRSLDYVEVFDQLNKLAVVPDLKWNEVMNVYREFEYPLLTAQDLISLENIKFDVKKTTEILKKVRCWQIKTKTKNAEDCIKFIVKNIN